jgi:hypothetical protein
MTVESTAAQGDPLAYRLGPFHHPGREWPPDELRLRGGDHVRAFLFRDALRSS